MEREGAELKSACSGSIAVAGQNEHRCVSAQKEPVGVDGFNKTAGSFSCSATKNISTLDPCQYILTLQGFAGQMQKDVKYR